MEAERDRQREEEKRQKYSTIATGQPFAHDQFGDH